MELNSLEPWKKAELRPIRWEVTFALGMQNTVEVQKQDHQSGESMALSRFPRPPQNQLIWACVTLPSFMA